MGTPESLRRYDDPSYFTSIEVRSNGLRFHVKELAPTHAGAKKKLALCLHGFPESSYSWRYQMQLLADEGYRVWAPDLRGYGETDRPERVADYALTTLADDVGGLIDAAGADEVLLVAHDWGGAIAWDFVLRGVRPVDRFVVLNIPHPKRLLEELKRLGPQLRRSWYIFFFQLPKLPEWWLARRDHRAIAAAFRGMAVDKSRFPREVLDVYRANAAKPGAVRAMLAYYRAAVRAAGTKVRYPVLRVPTLMIWGEEDTALGKELTYGTEKLVESLTLRYVPGCSHWVQQEKPEIVNAMVRAWLRDEPVPEAAAIEAAAIEAAAIEPA